MTVVCETTFVGIHLEVGDRVTIAHPELPEAADQGLFELIRITTTPEVPHARPMPLRLVGHVQTRRTFDYFAIRDQANVVWYWWITRAGTLDWSLTPPAIATRIANDLALSPIPSWLAIGGVVADASGLRDLFMWASMPLLAAIRYIVPTALTGAPDVLVAAPPLGIEYAGSPILRGQGTGEWTITVTEADTILVESV